MRLILSLRYRSNFHLFFLFLCSCYLFPSRHTTSFQRLIDVETTSFVYWVLICGICTKTSKSIRLKSYFLYEVFSSFKLEGIPKQTSSHKNQKSRMGLWHWKREKLTENFTGQFFCVPFAWFACFSWGWLARKTRVCRFKFCVRGVFN